MDDNNIALNPSLRTKSIEKALAPISAQVAQLVVLNAAWQCGDLDSVQASTLIESATSVMTSADELAKVGQRIAIETNDQILMKEMPDACECLSIAGHNLLTATHRVHVDNFDLNCRQHLVSVAHSLLAATLRVLLTSDDAEVRKIVDAAGAVLQRLRLLTGVKTMKHLIPSFESVMETLSHLIRLCDRRQLDVACRHRRERLLVAMATMRKCVPMLSSAMRTCVKFDANLQTQGSRDYVIGQMIESIDDIINVVSPQNEDDDDDNLWDDSEEPGHFVTIVDRLQYRLSADEQSEMTTGSDYDLLIEGAVRHAMAVAQISDASHRELIVKNCQRVFLQKSVASQLSATASPQPDFSELHADTADAWRHLATEVGDLERRVVAATLRLITDAFCETKQPAERLANAACVWDVTSDQINVIISSFRSHADKMCQVARFAVAVSSDVKRVRQILSCVVHLERLDPEIVPASLACHQRRRADNESCVHHLRLLMREWTNNVDMIISAINCVVDPMAFIRVSETCIRNDVGACREISLSETTQANAALRTLIGRSLRMSQVAMTVIERQENAVHRSELRALASKLDKVLSAAKSAGLKAISSPANTSLAMKYHTRCHSIVAAVAALKARLDGEGHLHIDGVGRAQPITDLPTLDLDASQTDCDIHLKNNVTTHITRKVAQTVKDEDVQGDLENVNERLALKEYVNELTSEKMADFVKALSTAAIASTQQRVDLLGNDVLTMTNHIAEMANIIATSVDTTRKQTLERVSAEVTSLAPKLLDATRKVAQSDVSQVEPLYEISDTWAKMVSYLERYVDGIVQKWLTVSYGLVDAVKLKDRKLASAQVSYIKQHSSCLERLVSAAQQVANSVQSSLQIATRWSQVQQDSDSFKSLTSTFVTVADMLTASDGAKDHCQLDMIARHWACSVFAITSSIYQLTSESLSVIGVRLGSSATEDVSTLERDMKHLTDETLRVKDLTACILSARSENATSADLQLCLNDLDQLTAELHNCTDMLTHITAPYHTAEKMYAPYSRHLLQWQWQQKLQHWNLIIDEITADFIPELTKPTVGGAADAAAACRHGISNFQENFRQCKGSLLALLRHSAIPAAVKADLRRHLEALSATERQLSRHLTRNGGADDSMLSDADFSRAMRKWAVKSYTLVMLLRTVDTSGSRAVKEVTEFLTVTNDENRISKSTVVKDAVKMSPPTPVPKVVDSCHRAKDNSRTPLAVKSFNSVAPSSDLCWKAMKAGPVTNHTTPEPPSGNIKRPTYGSRPAGHMMFDKWKGEDNEIVHVATQITQQFDNMAAFPRRQGMIRSREEMIETAKAIASNGEKLVKFVRIIARYCLDQSFARELQQKCDKVPLNIAQLQILAGVKSVTPDDLTTERMLIKTAGNLVDAIKQILTAAETACIKGLSTPAEGATDDVAAVELGMRWRCHFEQQREQEASCVPTDDLGLRRVDFTSAPPSLGRALLRH